MSPHALESDLDMVRLVEEQYEVRIRATIRPGLLRWRVGINNINIIWTRDFSTRRSRLGPLRAVTFFINRSFTLGRTAGSFALCVLAPNGWTAVFALLGNTAA